MHGLFYFPISIGNVCVYICIKKAESTTENQELEMKMLNVAVDSLDTI